MFHRPSHSSRLLRGLLLSLVAAVAACTCGEKKPAVPPVAALVQHSGALTLERGTERPAPAPDAPLYTGDVIATGDDGRAVLRYTNGTEIEVSPKTRFRLGGVPGALTLELEMGSLLSRARTEGSGGLSILTRYGSAAIVQGSEVTFNLSGDGGSMDVAFGEITVRSPDGGTRVVLAGDAFDLMLAAEAAAADAGTELADATPQPLEMMFEAQRAAYVRPVGARRFVPAKGTAPIAAGTGLQIRQGGAARLSSEGLGVAMNGGTTGVVGEAKAVGGVDTYALAVEGGELSLAVDGLKKRELTLTGRGREATLRSEEAALARARTTLKATEIDVLAGTFIIESNGTTHTVGAGERLVLGSAGQAEKVARPAPVLTVPHSKRVRVYADNLAELGLQLPPSETALQVEVARDAEFKDVVLAGKVSGEVVSVPAVIPGELYWRALGPDGAVVVSGQARLFRDGGRSMVDLDNPRAEVAETGLKASVLFQSGPPSLTFSFAPTANAKQYRVRVYRASELKTPIAEQVVSEPRCTFEAGRIPEGDYVWFAAPLDANGSELSGGRMNRLELVYDNSRTSLAIARPRPNEVVTARATAVQGIAPLGARLYVNGKSAPVDPKGRFTLSVARAQTLVFRVVRDETNESYWVRQLRRRR